MPSQFFRLLFLASLVFIAPALAVAEPIETTSHVTAATIFSDRALVTRIAKVHIPTGAQIISLTDVPAGFDESSLRVEGKAAASVKIGTVDVKHIYLTEQANIAEREKTAALEAKSDEKALLEGDLTAIKAREGFINRIVAAGADMHEKDDLSKLDFTPEKWEKAWNLIQNGMNETEKELALKNVAMRKLDLEISKLQQELGQVESSKARERRDVQINVEAAQETDLNLSLTYQTGSVSWRPVYDARLETGDGTVDLEQYGMTSQQTGEDWNDISLTLSTAQPASGSEMPRMSEWWVRLLQPIMARQQYSTFSVGGGMAKESNMAAQLAMPAPAAIAMDEMKVEGNKDASVEQAAVQSTEYAAEFHVPGRVSIKSVRDSSKMFIGTVHMKAGLASQVSPRLMPQAFLFAKIMNNESYPLIPGIVAKYRDGSFIGNAPFALLRPGETANLSFGVDDRVKVTYQRTREEQNNPALIVVGDMKIERQYQTKIENLHKEPITITIFEQVPVSGDPDVKVELLEDSTTPGHAEDPDKRQGVITWSGTYQPKEEKTFTFGFQVKYPKDRQISGL